jgi:hypothetical protein
MVKDSGATVRADRLRPLNSPRPLRVEIDEQGKPIAVGEPMAGKARHLFPIQEILDQWRIDDEWWRKEVSRMYFRVALEGGQLLTLFQDLTSGRWYGQTSATPLPSAEAVMVPAVGVPAISAEKSAATPVKRAG